MSGSRDQADTLRKLMSARTYDSKPTGTEDQRPSARVITVSSGKGGVGKSWLVANLGVMLARSGLRTLLLDGDFGLANLDILLGVQPQVTLEEVLRGKASLKQAIIGIERNLWLIPSASGLLDLRQEGITSRQELLKLFEKFPWEMDVILVDIGAGISPQVLSLHNPTYETVVMVTPEPTAMTDAYGLIKLLRREAGIHQVSVIVNQVTDGQQGQNTFKKLNEVASRFIDIQLDYLGHLARDEKVLESVMKRKILLDLLSSGGSRVNSASGALACLELVAKRLKSKCLGLKPLTSSRSASEVNEAESETQVNTTKFFRTLLGEVKA